jgi:hypothetical protein
LTEDQLKARVAELEGFNQEWKRIDANHRSFHEKDRELITRLASDLREKEREYLKLQSVLIRISNGTDLDPVKTAEDALKGKI